ncbi:PLD nuclease N-terminal domain-containing protein [Actinoplanes sp. NPDC024001]|uniref:PLD nuclease N-terminal domain-containing protein n=1 Tax=Actinoplanes sp. NPDC024001 TaxID=3154598 RepID=UPI0033DF32BF
MTHTSWQDLQPWQRTATMVLAPVELALTAYAAVDLARRPRSRVRGSKAIWWPIIFIQPVGPIAYLIRGRRS